MTLSIELTLAEEARLREAATREGLEPAALARRLVTEHLPVSVPAPTEGLHPGMTFGELLAPLQEDFEKSGMSEAELDALIEEAREEVWQERQGHHTQDRRDGR